MIIDNNNDNENNNDDDNNNDNNNNNNNNNNNLVNKLKETPIFMWFLFFLPSFLIISLWVFL